MSRLPPRGFSYRRDDLSGHSSASHDVVPSLHGFIDQAVDRPIQRDQTEGEHLLPRVYRVVSLLKRWLLGTHQGAIAPAHWDYYLDEFTFRFNRRKSASRGKLFYRLIQQAVQIGPHPYQSLIKPH